jgi:hypothetical protein
MTREAKLTGNKNREGKQDQKKCSGPVSMRVLVMDQDLFVAKKRPMLIIRKNISIGNPISY